MDNFDSNRLNFSNIVEKHLRNIRETKYFKPTQVSAIPSKWTKFNKNEKVHDSSNIQAKIDSIVANVHTQLIGEFNLED